MAQAEFTSAEHERSGVPAEGGAFRGAGQNARLAAKLTGWKIDIKPASAPDPEPEAEEELILDDEPEAGE